MLILTIVILIVIFFYENHGPSFLVVWVGPSFSWWGIGKANNKPERADPNLEKEGPALLPRKKNQKGRIMLVFPQKTLRK